MLQVLSLFLSGNLASVMCRRGLTAGALAIVMLAAPVMTSAQVSRVGSTAFPKPPDGGTRRFSAVAYDGANNAYLVAWGVINLGLRFVSAGGVPLGEPAALNTDGVARQAGAVRVACGAEINACLVTWVEELPTRVVGRLVRNSGGAVQFLTDRFPISQTGVPKHTESAPGVAYSSGSREFLVTWAEYSSPGGPDVKGQRVSTAGVPIGDQIPVGATGYWEGLPSATYNSALDEFFVTYYFEPGQDAVGATRVKAGTGAIVANTTLYTGPFEKYPEVVYNSVENQYLAVSWSANWILHGQRVDGSGNAFGAVLPLATGGGDGIGVGYNPVSNSYLAVYLRPDSDEVWGAVITSAGATVNQFQVTSSGTRLATQPQVAGSKAAPQWLVVGAEQFRRVMSQLVQNGGAASPPSPPPPAPGPAPVACSMTFSKASESFGPNGGG
ncbi:MAG: hypothetical protein H0W08_20540, partial [Acidobacteria bacterium]|nr:hypothetical protein [Acidobacteriota bacterium]